MLLARLCEATHRSSRFWVLSALATSCTVNTALVSFAGSSTTSISRVSLESTSILPAPGTRASSGRTT